MYYQKRYDQFAKILFYIIQRQIKSVGKALLDLIP